jgi:hypothetical protein
MVVGCPVPVVDFELLVVGSIRDEVEEDILAVGVLSKSSEVRGSAERRPRILCSAPPAPIDPGLRGASPHRSLNAALWASRGL